MRRSYIGRKVAPKVKDGRVRKKHNHQPTAALGYVIDRQSPARGHKHVITKQEVRLFTGLIPDWESLCVGIDSIVLSAGADYEGLYYYFRREHTASIELVAWNGDLWQVLSTEYFTEHRWILDQLNVVSEKVAKGVECRFTLAQAKAFTLLHIFLHELGHHVDRMQSKSQKLSRRGEPFAERYANDMAKQIWPAYIKLFGDPRR
jgi:hypothetical protein